MQHLQNFSHVRYTQTSYNLYQVFFLPCDGRLPVASSKVLSPFKPIISHQPIPYLLKNCRPIFLRILKYILICLVLSGYVWPFNELICFFGTNYPFHFTSALFIIMQKFKIDEISITKLISFPNLNLLSYRSKTVVNYDKFLIEYLFFVFT